LLDCRGWPQVWRSSLRLKSGADEPFIFALDGFAIDEQCEPIFERKTGDIGLPPLLLEGFRHAQYGRSRICNSMAF